MNNCQRFDLTTLGVIRASGEDSEHFLQGQLSNDISAVSAGHSQLDGYCTPKGRMIANMRVLSHQGDFLLLLPKERLAPVLQRLGMYILMSKVTLTDVSDEMQIMGLYGDCAAALSESELPAGSDDCITAEDNVSIVRIAADAPRCLLIGSAGSLEDRSRQLAATTTPGSEEEWRLLDIRAGLPTVYDATAEAFVPQMLNMHLVNGVSFTKGCYTGQEVVARMHYLGKLKRRMYRVGVAGECPAAGAALYSAASQSGQGSGTIVMSAPSGEQTCEALAVIEAASIAAGDVRLHDENGARLEFLQLPYAFEESNK
ncbi:MAG: folate-binding protein [Pseudomonadota bacterium]